ncbi:unnamed protein product [Tenebrio molitor]|nr:unnamed protein product [Tenebrio molitor]
MLECLHICTSNIQSCKIDVFFTDNFITCQIFQI